MSPIGLQNRLNQEATLLSTIARFANHQYKVKDYVLFGATTVINGTPLHTLVDSRATPSFIDTRL